MNWGTHNTDFDFDYFDNSIVRKLFENDDG